MSNKSNGGKRRITLSEKEIKLRFFWSLILFCLCHCRLRPPAYHLEHSRVVCTCAVQRMTAEERSFFSQNAENRSKFVNKCDCSEEGV